MVVDVLPVAVEALAPREQRAGAVRGSARLAQGRASLRARQAMAAARHEHHDDVVALLEVVDAGADLLDDARRLVAERHRHRPRPVALDHRQVRVAQPRRRDLDQDLARSRRVELDRLDLQRLRLRVGRRSAHLVQHGGSDFHAFSPARRRRVFSGRAPARRPALPALARARSRIRAGTRRPSARRAATRPPGSCRSCPVAPR